MPQPRPYRWLAEYYDLFFQRFRHPLDAAREQLLGGILASIGSACDLACGTGTTALTLARNGVRTYAVDNSAAMCRITRGKARQQHLLLRVIRADMRDFVLPERVDLVLCEGDALNHVPEKADLGRVAQAAARALNHGGYFYFDVNNRAGFRRYWSSTIWMERPGAAVLMRNQNDARNDRAWSDIDWFIQEGTLWRRRRERVEQVCWSAEEIKGALADAGFSGVRHWDAARFFKGNAMVRRGCRTFFLARKGTSR